MSGLWSTRGNKDLCLVINEAIVSMCVYLCVWFFFISFCSATPFRLQSAVAMNGVSLSGFLNSVLCCPIQSDWRCWLQHIAVQQRMKSENVNVPTLFSLIEHLII